MATYKVIQDIEAEDKLIGPLTLRQFLYAVIVIVLGFFAFRLALLKWFLALPFLPPMILFGVLAAPFGHDQPSEVWLLARIRFFLKPKRRIWDQSGMKELVTVTVPKRPEKIYTNGLTQIEVRSRLRALADTIDSRGWAIKNVNVNLYSQPGYAATSEDSDRLVGPSNLPQQVSNIDVRAADDILDPQNNPVAHQLEEMISASEQVHRQQVLTTLDAAKNPSTAGGSAAPATDYWFMHSSAPQPTDPGLATFAQPQVVTPGAQPVPNNDSPVDEQALLAQLHPDDQLESISYGHLRTIQPLSAQRTVTSHQSSVVSPGTISAGQVADDTKQATATSRAPLNPDILELAKNDDFTVATIARQAERASHKASDGEVVVNLH